MSTLEQLRERFPRASATFLRLNTEESGEVAVLNSDSRPVAKLERNLRNGAVGEVQVQKGLGRQFFVRVTSYRKRLLDQDNLAEKYHIDLLRYAGVIPGDAPKTTRIEVCQEKVGPKEPERTIVEVFETSSVLNHSLGS